MPSAAEQLAANFNFATLGKAHELRQRILFTLGALIVARLGTSFPCRASIPIALAPADQPARAAAARRLQRAGGRRGQPHGDLCLGHHALHLGLHHYSADDHRLSGAGSPEEGRRGGPQSDEPVHPLRHGSAGRDPGLWHRAGAGHWGMSWFRNLPACFSVSPRSSP